MPVGPDIYGSNRVGLMNASEQQFSELFTGNHEAVGRYCLRRLPPDDARDALTETYLIAWKRIEDAPPGDETVLWLYGIARNVVRNRNRSSRRSVRLVARLVRDPAVAVLDPVHQIIRQEEDRELLDAMTELSASDREILRLRAYEELSYEQVSIVLGCSEDAARQRSSRALKRLGARLDVSTGEPARVNQEGGPRYG